MKKFALYFSILLSVLSLTACKNSGRKPLLPSISGKAGEVLVVINKGDWESSAGNELRSLLASDCPYLPQKEPLYTLINITPGTFTDIFRIHRNIILVNIDPKVTDPGIVHKTDVWAGPQCVIGINAPDGESAAEIIRKNGKTLLNTIEQAERDRVIANSIQYEEHVAGPAVTALTGGAPHFPTGYVLKKQTSDFIWVSYDTQYTTQAMLVFKYPVKGENPLGLENLIAMHNEFMKNNVPGMFENTYMKISDAAQPGLEYIKFRGREFAQMRGLWDVHNDYMGGPFVSHSFYSQDGKDIITLISFVYAPRYDKRHYLRQIESIMYSFEWKK